MQTPIDQSRRARFVTELDQNFSVIAAAGSGKTRAITDRIVRIAQDQRGKEWLPQLVVVAFTNRAADEMQQRARAEILRAGVSFEVLPAFNRAFFGTIHSFCVRLLEMYGHHLGLPPRFDLVREDDPDLWNEFVQQQTVIGRALSDENRRELLRHVQVRHLMELARRGDLGGPRVPPQGPCPPADFTKVYAQAVVGAARQNVKRMQRDLRIAEQTWKTCGDFVRWPGCLTKAKNFVPIWREAFAPLREWIDQNSLCVAAEVQRDYREFRVERGVLTYADQVALALQLIRHPRAAKQIREKNLRIILDEAQDTDPQQFSLLLEAARPATATGDWLEVRNDPPRPGHFCMVGDFQQSIYRDRADLSRYRRIHQTLLETGAAEALEFSVTFRLDTAQLGFVNATFRDILNNTDNQVEFVEMKPRPAILPGQVIRLDIPVQGLKPDARGKISDARKAAHEARRIAQWLRAVGLKKLRANSWRDVAILCPRKEWLQTLRRALRDTGFIVQVQSEKESKGDSPAYAWLAALVTIMTEPRSSYEIVGVLREVFGISDHDLAVFCNGDSELFQIETSSPGTDAIAQELSLLTETRTAVEELPLFTAVSEIVRRTALRDRLQSLPPEDFEDLHNDLESLLALAAASEAEQKSLADFAETLRMHFGDPREVRPSAVDAIQLITAQKAKGSEWQAVVVPFLTREVRPASPRYPRLMRDSETGETILALEKYDVIEYKDALDRQERQEMERLLYVALTRARHTLVLVFDKELFAKSNGEAHSASQARWLRADNHQSNFAVVSSVSAEAVECATTDAHIRKTIGDAQSALERNEIFDEAVDAKAALAQASVFVRKITPSALAPETPVETWAAVERRPPSGSPAIRYGNWWHEFVSQLQWRSGSQPEERVINAALTASPDPARSRREWLMLAEHLRSDSDFRRRISAQFAQSEMPFFWKADDSRCLEGNIDLALFDRGGGRTLILDWKTNRIAADKADQLRARYRPQIAAYWKAITQMTSQSVEAGIYATATGQFLLYDEAELAREWERLNQLSAGELMAATSVA